MQNNRSFRTGVDVVLQIGDKCTHAIIDFIRKLLLGQVADVVGAIIIDRNVIRQLRDSGCHVCYESLSETVGVRSIGDICSRHSNDLNARIAC